MKRKKIGYAFYEHRYDDGSIGYRYHNTDVLVMYPDTNEFSMNNDGYYTITTKRKINKVLPIGYIYQKNNEWFFVDNKERTFLFDNIKGNKIRIET